ncbi:MAG TPA: glycosyltransferase family 39 protein [Lacunisphaera sp.]|nr:glycosyltransferase family 39 protein [Lacunisphaera sp.]
MSWLTGLVLLLALGHAALATLASREKSTTADELAHVTGGYTFNHWNDYRLHPENGLLPQRWQALPTTLSGAKYPDFTTDGWRHSVVWLVGYDFFYQSGNDADRLLFSARAMNSLFGAATVALVFAWSYGLWGLAGAVVSGVFCALCPTMLAHSGLATSDMCMTFFFLAFVTAYWRHLHDGRARAWWLSAGLLGLAALAKYTAVLLLPLAAVLALVRALQSTPLALGGRTFASPAGRLGAIVASTAAQGLVALAVVWAGFGFRYNLFNPALPVGEPNLPWEILLNFGGGKAALINTCREWHLLPEGWLYGLAFVLQHAQARAAFLDGDYGVLGWVDFFPKTFLYKTPPALLAGLVAAVLLVGLRLRTATRGQLGRHFSRVAPLVALFGIYWLFSLTSHLNIGHRHILPTYPVLYIFCGALGWAVTRAWRHSPGGGRVGAVIVAGLLGWQAATAAGIHPHYLAYFSPVIGGPAEGYRHLVDSSLDWGQDLPALKKWVSTHRQPGERLYVSYFGSDEPARFIPDAVLLPRLPTFERVRPRYWCEPGLYAVSATMLQQVYMPGNAGWPPDREQRYQQLRLNDAHFRALAAHPDKLPPDAAGLTRDEWNTAWALYEQLRFARLCYYLRARRPDAMAGYSILIYRLSEAELTAALERDASTLGAAVERATAH